MVPAEAGTRSGFGMLVGRSFDSALGRASLGFGMAEDSGTLLPRGLAVGQGLSIAGEMELATRIGGKIDLTLAAGYGTTASHRSVAFNSGSVTLGSGGVFSASDQVSLSVGLPVAVAKGQTSLTLPIATRSGAAEFRDISIDLAPPAREIRFGLSYTYRIGDQAGLQASLAHAQNLGHVAGRSGSAAVVGVQVRF